MILPLARSDRQRRIGRAPGQLSTTDIFGVNGFRLTHESRKIGSRLEFTYRAGGAMGGTRPIGVSNARRESPSIRALFAARLVRRGAREACARGVVLHPKMLSSHIEREPIVLKTEDVAVVALRMIKDLQKLSPPHSVPGCVSYRIGGVAGQQRWQPSPRRPWS